MRKVKYLILVIVLLCSCSCNEREVDLKMKISALDKTLIDLATEVYTEPQLMSIVAFDGSLNELDAKYPIECLRECDEIYRASYLGNESVAVVWFDQFGNKILGRVYLTRHTKADFNALTSLDSLKKVQEIAPEGEYLFLETGRNDIPRVSSHYTTDGYLITIEYDVFGMVMSAKTELL